jgi:hypothetical protein
MIRNHQRQYPVADDSVRAAKNGLDIDTVYEMKGRLAQIDANRMEPLGWNNVETFLKNGPPDKGRTMH